MKRFSIDHLTSLSRSDDASTLFSNSRRASHEQGIETKNRDSGNNAIVVYEWRVDLEQLWKWVQNKGGIDEELQRWQIANIIAVA